MDNPTKTTHPLILAAAGSIIIASLAAAAHFTGLIPSRSSEPNPPPVASTAPATPTSPAAAPEPPAPEKSAAAPETAKPAVKPHAPRQVSRGVEDRRYEDRRHDDGNRRVANNAGIDVIPSSPAPAPVAAAPAPAPTPPVCHECGTVENVREITTQGEGSALGAIAGGLLGGVLGHQVGHGSGKDLATIAGAVGGAMAGNQVEKNVRTGHQYQVAVRFDDGNLRTYTMASATWRTGDRVRLANGSLTPIGTPDR